jgi:hypothetical protein
MALGAKHGTASDAGERSRDDHNPETALLSGYRKAEAASAFEHRVFRHAKKFGNPPGGKSGARQFQQSFIGIGRPTRSFFRWISQLSDDLADTLSGEPVFVAQGLECRAARAVTSKYFAVALLLGHQANPSILARRAARAARAALAASRCATTRTTSSDFDADFGCARTDMAARASGDEITVGILPPGSHTPSSQRNV